MAEPGKRIPPLHTIYWYITGSCNLNCRHCWIDPSFEPFTTNKYLPWATTRRIIEEAKEVGLRSVKLTGGEPMLHPEICDILVDLRSMDLSVRMETNGTLIREREVKAIKEARVDFSISLDGPTAEVHDNLRGVRGAFERTLAGIEHARAEGLSFQVICSLFRKNANLLGEMAQFAKGLGANSLKINVISRIARSAGMEEKGELLDIGEVLALKRKLDDDPAANDGIAVIFDVPPAFKRLREIQGQGFGTCGILGILGLLHDGRAGLCGIGEHLKELDFGDCLTLGVKKIWEENATLNLIRENLPFHLTGICGRCMFRNYCLGKCIAETYNVQKQLFGGFGFCEEAREMGLFPDSRIVEHRPHTGD